MKCEYYRKFLFSLMAFSCMGLMKAQITSYPYLEDFESGWGQWTVAWNNTSTWQHGIPSGTIINSASSGFNAWVTNLSGNYVDNEDGYLLSPIFDLSSLNSPTVQFKLWWNCEFNWDGVVLQSSIDGQFSWQKVGAFGTGTNWYNYETIASAPGGSSEGWTGRALTGNGSNGWVAVSHPLNGLAGQSNVYFRLVFASDGSVVDEGIGFDDFEIYNAYVSIPDTQFEQALIDEGIDSEGTLDGQVLLTDVNSVIYLPVNGYNVTSFEGLQYFTSLLSFEHINNQAGIINEIDFSGNSTIEQIDIINAPNLASIDISQNGFLQSLTVVTNNTLFNSIDLSNNFNLQTLILSSNGITDINTLNSPILSYLSVGDNPIASIDVSSFSDLTTLNTYDTQIEFLDLSDLFFLENLNAYNGSLKALNLQNGGGNTNNVENVDVSGNPDLECILVDSVAWAESPSGWIKDATASYFEDPSINFTTFPGSTTVQSDGSGNQTEFNAWLANNGGGDANTQCGSVNWTYEILAADDFDNTLEYIVEFLASTPYNGPDVTQATFTIENIADAGDSDGTNGTICTKSYDLANLISVDLNAPTVDNFYFEQFDSFPQVPDATFRGTIVDFPDTGAGSFSFTFRLVVESTIDVFNPATQSFESRSFESDAFLTVNDYTVPLLVQEPTIFDTSPICPSETKTVQELTDMLVLTPDPIGPDFDPNDYWYSDAAFQNPINPFDDLSPGTYYWNPAIDFPNCPVDTATVTILQEQELFAGNDVLDVEDQSGYNCGDTVSFDLNSFRDASADPGGKWYDDANNLIANGIVDFPDTGAGSFTKAFSYRQENDICGFEMSEASYEVSYSALGLSTGTSTSIEICPGNIITEAQLLTALGADVGGTWSPVLDPNDVLPGTYTYSLGDCTFEEDTSIEVIESALSINIEAQNETSSFFVSSDFPAVLDLDAFNNWLNNHGGATAASVCGNITWSYSYNVSYSDIQDNVTYLTTFVANDGVSSVNTTATFTFDNVFVSAGTDFIFQSDAGIDGGTRCGNDDFNLSIIDGFYIQYDESATFEFVQTEGPPGAAFNGSIVDFPDTGAGQYLYSFDFVRDLDVQFPDLLVELSDEAIVTFWVVIPFDVGEDGTLEVCEGQEVTLQDLYDALEGTPNLEGSNFDLEDLWTPSVYSGPDVYKFDFSKVAPDCSFDSSTVTVTESSICDNPVGLKVFLQGPYDDTIGLMKDDMRISGLLSTQSPYADGLTCNAAVFTVPGNNAIVDWIWLEVRDSVDLTTVVRATSALLQADGDIVGVDGISPVNFNIANGNYHLMVSHRNHLGVLTLNSVTFDGNGFNLDLTTTSSLVEGDINAIAPLGDGKFGLYAGDFNGDGQIQNSDKSDILPLIGLSGYNNADMNMDGEIQNTDVNLFLNPNIGRGEQFMSRMLFAKRY